MAGLRIALIHQGWPAGSFITTRGLDRALRRRDDVGATFRLPADDLEHLPENLDLVFVEGYPGKRRWRQIENLPIPKFYWWLSSNFGRMNPDRLGSSKLEHVFTNSQWGMSQLEGKLPISYLPLAFDRDMLDKAVAKGRYACDVTYVGVSGRKTRGQLRTMLDPATEFDFKLWGRGWGWTRYRAFHKGMLPAEDIPALYASAKVVLGITELREQALGMVNNRVFEALGCGSVLVSDHFPELEEFAGDYLLYARGPDETHSHVDSVLSEPEIHHQRARAAQDWVLSEHTYDLRAEKIIRVFRDRRTGDA